MEYLFFVSKFHPEKWVVKIVIWEYMMRQKKKKHIGANFSCPKSKNRIQTVIIIVCFKIMEKKNENSFMEDTKIVVVFFFLWCKVLLTRNSLDKKSQCQWVGN